MGKRVLDWRVYRVNKAWMGHNNRSSVTEIFRYSVVGVTSNVVGYLVYLFFTYLGCTPKLTMSLLYFTGATIGFYGNRSVTFAYKGSWLHSGLRYLMTHLAGYSINFSILAIFVDHLGYAHQLVQAAAILIVAGFLFTAFKFFVFKAPE